MKSVVLHSHSTISLTIDLLPCRCQMLYRSIHIINHNRRHPVLRRTSMIHSKYYPSMPLQHFIQTMVSTWYACKETNIEHTLTAPWSSIQTTSTCCGNARRPETNASFEGFTLSVLKYGTNGPEELKQTTSDVQSNAAATRAHQRIQSTLNSLISTNSYTIVHRVDSFSHHFVFKREN